MNEGWLFRLRSSLGSHQSVPAWPSSRADEASTLPSLRRPPAREAAPAEGACAIEAALCGPVSIEPAADETA